MDWKLFFKPNKCKILIFLGFIFIFLFLVMNFHCLGSYCTFLYEIYVITAPAALLDFSGLLDALESTIRTIIYFTISGIYWYFLSCFSCILIKSYRNRKRK